MKKIIVAANEIEVLSLNAYTYDHGRGEKVLRIEVDENTASFEDLKAVLNGNEEPIQYFEDDALKCEYIGYNRFTSQYADGKHNIELHMASMETQMVLLAASNERITAENARITAENGTLAGIVAGLQKENVELKEQINNIDISGGNGNGASWDEMAAAIEEGVNEV